VTNLVEQIAQSFIKFLPLVYNKLNKPSSKGSTESKTSELTHLQSHILEELFHTKEGFSMTELAHNINISKQQLTPLIMKMEKKEYVLKKTDDKDKRIVKIILTEKGSKTVTKRWEDFYHQFTERISSLKEEDLIDLDYAINKVIRIMIKLG